MVLFTGIYIILELFFNTTKVIKCKLVVFFNLIIIAKFFNIINLCFFKYLIRASFKKNKIFGLINDYFNVIEINMRDIKYLYIFL